MTATRSRHPDLTPTVRAALAGRYEVEREIGHGATAVVFLARAPGGAEVAVKMLMNKPATPNSKGLRFGNFVQGREVIQEEMEAAIAGAIEKHNVDFAVVCEQFPDLRLVVFHQFWIIHRELSLILQPSERDAVLMEEQEIFR